MNRDALFVKGFLSLNYVNKSIHNNFEKISLELMEHFTLHVLRNK